MRQCELSYGNIQQQKSQSCGWGVVVDYIIALHYQSTNYITLCHFVWFDENITLLQIGSWLHRYITSVHSIALHYVMWCMWNITLLKVGGGWLHRYITSVHVEHYITSVQVGGGWLHHDGRSYFWAGSGNKEELRGKRDWTKSSARKGQRAELCSGFNHCHSDHRSIWSLRPHHG